MYLNKYSFTKGNIYIYKKSYFVNYIFLFYMGYKTARTEAEN